MTQLSVALLGLGRLGASFGLALKRASDYSEYTFDITGYDMLDANRKNAQKMGAVDNVANQPYQAVKDKQIVIITLGYDDVQATLRKIKTDLRDGVVILDASPLKQPSLDWAKEVLDEDHHLIGITPLVNPKYIFRPMADTEFARADMFDESTMLITPSASALKEAVDLVFNLANLIRSKPRFMDTHDHDALLARTSHLPHVIGVALFHALSQRDDWHDLQWYTNPEWAVLTLPLRDIHPDGLRDEILNNRENMVRALDEYITQLQAYRDVIAEGDQDALEAALVESSATYQQWLTRRYKADWDDIGETKVENNNSFMGSLFGAGIAKRLMGRKDDDKE
jgi:prephenate dehydrogenase